MSLKTCNWGKEAMDKALGADASACLKATSKGSISASEDIMAPRLERSSFLVPAAAESAANVLSAAVDAFTECSAQSIDSVLCEFRAGNAAWMAAGCREGGRECRWRPRSPPCRCTATARSSDSPSNTYTADCFKYDTKYRSENAHTIPDCMLLVQECASRKDRAFRTLDVQSFTWHKA